MSKAKTRLVVAAIDFGSHGSGYAFSFRHQFDANPIDVSSPMWSPESGGDSVYKTPSAMLLDSNKNLVAFGHDAEDRYSVICEENEQNAWYYLKGFKMKLYRAVLEEKDIRKDFEMTDINGKAISAKLVIKLAIQYLRKHLLDQFEERNIGVKANDIEWVITVPAIWNDACKQFMRDAAEEAGIHGDMFSIVYEPEAASVYARLLPVEKLLGKNKTTILKTFDPGTKFIVVDAGGGTVDISTQEVAPNGELKIIHKVCGGSWGGEMVNEKYRIVLTKLVGGPVLKQFKREQGADYNEMMRDFERKKKTYKLNSTETVNTRFPVSLKDLIADSVDSSIDSVINESTFKDKISTKRDKMFIKPDLFQTFFKESCDLTVEEIRSVLNHPRCEDVSAIMMVGGFSESDVLQDAVKKAFPELEVFVPVDGGLSVLKGAVIYGHNPNIVASRVCNYTYGVSLSVPFKTGVHPESKRYTWDKEDWCRHVFHICFTADEDVKVGDIRQIELNDTFVTADSQCRRTHPLRAEIYISDKPDPKFVTEEGCQKHAVIHVKPSGGQWPEQVFGWVELKVAGTEMIGTYVNATTKERTSTKFEFLPSGYKFTKGEKKRLFDPAASE